MEPLHVPDDDVWLASLGVLPATEKVSGDEYVREVVFPITESEQLHLTWDTTDQSVRIRYSRASEVLVDLYRERATLLTVENGREATALVVEYRAVDSVGRTRIQVTPTVAIEDSFLRA